MSGAVDDPDDKHSIGQTTSLLKSPASGMTSRGLSLSVSMADTDMDSNQNDFSASSLSSITPTDSRFHLSLAEFRKYTCKLVESVNDSVFDCYDDELEELQRRCVSSNLKQFIDVRSCKMTKKNRYSNVLPYAHTRVRLSVREKDPDSDYINANFVKANLKGSSTTYISTQAPLPNTISDFWRMILEQNSSIIIMLTPDCERDSVKSDTYWPKKVEQLKSLGYGISILLKSESRSGDVTTRIVEIHCSESMDEPRVVTHIQYLGWPDHGVPYSFSSYMDVFNSYRSLRDQSSGPVVVHCSAGIGRTGTFIGIDAAIDEFHQILNTGDHTNTICLLDLVYCMRTQRPGMVQTKAQYQFIYEFLGYYLNQL